MIDLEMFLLFCMEVDYLLLHCKNTWVTSNLNQSLSVVETLLFLVS